MLLMSPEYVRAYVKAQKNDDRDAGRELPSGDAPNYAFLRRDEDRRSTRYADYREIGRGEAKQRQDGESTWSVNERL